MDGGKLKLLFKIIFERREDDDAILHTMQKDTQWRLETYIDYKWQPVTHLRIVIDPKPDSPTISQLP